MTTKIALERPRNYAKASFYRNLNEQGIVGWGFASPTSTGRFTQTEIAFTDYSMQRVFFSPLHLTLMNKSEIYETVLHEIAHILVSDPDLQAHGPEWRRKARELGIPKPRACSPLHYETWWIENEWIGKCPKDWSTKFLVEAPLGLHFCQTCQESDVLTPLVWRHRDQLEFSLNVLPKGHQKAIRKARAEDLYRTFKVKPGAKYG